MMNSTVYVVDDDPAILDSLTLLIQSNGLKTASFDSAASFLNCYSPEQPGCLLLDVRMPIMGGLELQEELSKRNFLIPIIFVSGDAEVPESVKAFKAGAVDFIKKPYDANLLMERIHEALAKDLKFRKWQTENNKIMACFNSLTAREKQVLKLICNSHSNKQVGKKLDISYRTVDVHRARIMEKMQAADIIELVIMTMSHTLFSTPDSTAEEA